MASPAEVDVGAFGGGKASKFKINASGVKVYPAVVYSQRSIVAGVALAKRIGSIDRIAALEITAHPRGYEQAGRDPEKWTPQNRDTADHSLPYLAVRAMVDGDITNASYAPDKLKDPKILALMKKTTVRPDPDFAKQPRGNAPATRLTATLTDGTTVTHQVDNMPGFPVDRAGMEHKFRSNTQGRWPAAKTDAILKALWDFERASDLRALLGQLSFA